jgi:outer membrane protein assembly factor BamB
MSDGTLPGATAPSPPAAPAAAIHPRRVWPHVVMGGMVVLSAVELTLLWLVWEPPFGESIQNLITYAQLFLLAVLFVIWLGLFAPFSRRTRLWGVAVLVVPAIAYAASIKHIAWTGDMRIIVHYRWEETTAERLAAHRAKAPPPPAATLPASIRPEDMPCYRGAGARGEVIGPPLLQDWEASPPREVWRQPCGGGYAQFAVVEPVAVTIEQRHKTEAVVCYDTATGAERWVHAYEAHFQEAMGGPGPRATPTIHDGAVYALGAEGTLLKLALADGSVLWERNILRDHQAPNTEWGMTSSPVVWNDLLLVNPGGPKGKGLAAYRLADGELVWSAVGAREFASGGTVNRAGYSTPVVTTLHGVEQVLLFDGTGLRSYRPADGALLWEHPHENNAGVNVAQPIIFDDGRIFISCSYNVGCKMLQVRREGESWKVEVLWANQKLRCKFTSPILFGSHLYGIDEGFLTCLDPDSGEALWKKSRQARYGHGQMLLTNGQLLIHTEDGYAVLVNPSPEGLQEVTRMRTLDDPKNWNPPALVEGRLYVRNHREMACFDLCGTSREAAR